MLEALEEIYGEFEENEKKWITENLKNLGEENEQKYLQVIQEEHSRRQGKPDIHKMKKVLEKVTGKKPKSYIWAVCNNCKCEYDYRLPMCPKCYENGLRCTSLSVKMSEFQPPVKVIRYNKRYIENADKNEPVCYNCEHKENSYCPHFGDPDFTCRREDFEYCPCKRCCSYNKRRNAEIKQEREVSEDKYPMAVPLIKV